MLRMTVMFCLMAMPCAAWPQVLKLDNLDRLAAKATDQVNVSLDGDLLRMAARFLSDDGDSDTADVKRLVSKLKGISIRSYTFKNAGAYSESDVEPVRSQLADPSWKRVVQVRSKTDGDSDVYVKSSGGKIQGLAVIAAQPKELTIVSIDGAIDPDEFDKLRGNFGIPKPAHRTSEEKGK